MVGFFAVVFWIFLRLCFGGGVVVFCGCVVLWCGGVFVLCFCGCVFVKGASGGESVGEECCRQVLEKSVVEECCREVLEKRVGM